MIADTSIGRVPEAAACADKFRKEGVDITLSVTPCWCYGSETMDMEKDTIKAVDGDGLVSRTLDRGVLRAVQTPQVFETDLIKGALVNAMQKNKSITDDCSAVELLRVPVYLTEGDEENIKITTPLDICLAEAILARREQAE